MRFALRRLATGKDFFEKKSLPDPLSKKLLKRNTKMHAFLYFAKEIGEAGWIALPIRQNRTRAKPHFYIHFYLCLEAPNSAKARTTNPMENEGKKQASECEPTENSFLWNLH